MYFTHLAFYWLCVCMPCVHTLFPQCWGQAETFPVTPHYVAQWFFRSHLPPRDSILPADFDSVLRLEDDSAPGQTHGWHHFSSPTHMMTYSSEQKGCHSVSLLGWIGTSCRGTWIYENHIWKTVPKDLLGTPGLAKDNTWAPQRGGHPATWGQWLHWPIFLPPRVCIEGPAGRELDHPRCPSWAESLLLTQHSFVQGKSGPIVSAAEHSPEAPFTP